MYDPSQSDKSRSQGFDLNCWETDILFHLIINTIEYKLMIAGGHLAPWECLYLTNIRTKLGGDKCRTRIKFLMTDSGHLDLPLYPWNFQ